MSVSPLRMIYLALAVWGTVQPMRYFAQWFAENGMSVAGLFAAWSANAASNGLKWDLIIAAIALTIWIVAETRVRRNWSAFWAIPVTFLIGLSAGLPLYLFLRTRPV